MSRKTSSMFSGKASHFPFHLQTTHSYMPNNPESFGATTSAIQKYKTTVANTQCLSTRSGQASPEGCMLEAVEYEQQFCRTGQHNKTTMQQTWEREMENTWPTNPGQSDGMMMPSPGAKLLNPQWHQHGTGIGAMPPSSSFDMPKETRSGMPPSSSLDMLKETRKVVDATVPQYIHTDQGRMQPHPFDATSWQVQSAGTQPNWTQASRPQAPEPTDLPLCFLSRNSNAVSCVPTGTHRMKDRRGVAMESSTYAEAVTKYPAQHGFYNLTEAECFDVQPDDNWGVQDGISQVTWNGLQNASNAKSGGSSSGFQKTHHKDTHTTLMIRNIPPMYMQDALANEWPNNGTYDFFYLPCTCALERNKSYAFINFTSHQNACDFKNRWNKKRLSQFANHKSLSVAPADLQGFQANLLQFSKNKKWRHKVQGCQPLIFHNGREISLDEAFCKIGPQASVLHPE